MMQELKNKSLWLLDMDGTIYLGDKLFEGTKPFLNLLDERGDKYVFITNNSSKSVELYLNKLDKMGINCSRDNFFSSSMSTALYIKRNHPRAKIYLCGTEALKKELVESGISIVEAKDADLVLLGYDTELNYKKITDVCNILTLKKDIPYLATNADWLCPASPCYLPDCGAIAKMLETAVHRLPYVIGKPNVHIIEDLLEKFKIAKENAVIVGDRLYTDIASANNAGIDSICVLSGEASLEDIRQSKHKPKYIIQDVLEIYNILR